MIKVLTDRYSLRYFGRIYGFEVVVTYATEVLHSFFFFFPILTPPTTKTGWLDWRFNENEIIAALPVRKGLREI